MDIILSGANVFTSGAFKRCNIRISDGIIAEISSESISGDAAFVDCSENFIFPGLVDVHVHLREPGFLYKETVATGTAAAARGGFTSVCAMPNLSPVPDCAKNLLPQLHAIEKDALINVFPYGAITVGQRSEALADMDSLAPYVFAFSDDGKGVKTPELMRCAMLKAKALNKIIVAHCEDEPLVRGGVVHDGIFAREHNLTGNPSESEWRQVERDLALVKETGCSYHVCHVSTKESVALIRAAKAEGLDVTCETAPHYLIFCDEDLQDDGRFKMNPPIRGREDRQALIAGILDGTVDMIATDHAPHSAAEKSGGLTSSLNGIVGLETAFASMYTHLVKPGIITLEKLIGLMHTAPSRRFGIGSGLEVGSKADLTVFDLNSAYIVDPAEFLSLGKSSPFTGMPLYGKCRMTVCGGKTVYMEGGEI